ncbi:MAG TPA: hypothetical protein VGX23_14200 [Actinocrinis sp.]|nr:hypothetical protein [Actinocrinis sp.]
MSMDKTKAASKASDEKLRAAVESGDTASVQLGNGITKMRDQVCRAGLGKAGQGRK